MLICILSIANLWWFCHTDYLYNWSKIMVGCQQVSFSLSALVIIFNLMSCLYGLIVWNKKQKLKEQEKNARFLKISEEA